MVHTHVTSTLGGVRVTFPFPPYDIQREYMEAVIEALKNKKNALLESPTGTGKTLSLLCSSLAWQQAQPNAGRIFYLSRTHVQLNQAANEMKRTAYAKVSSVVLSSRGRMCLNEDVRHQPEVAINRACKNATYKKACAFYLNYKEKMKELESDTVHDIEDLCNFGRNKQCCPYYTSKKFAKEKASLVFMPYNYLLDLNVGKSQELSLGGSVVIFDEGHNIESSLKDSASAKFTQKHLETILVSCTNLPEKLSEALDRELHGLTRYGYNPKNTGIVDEFAKPKEKKSKKQTDGSESENNVFEELKELLTPEAIDSVYKCASSLLKCKDLLKLHEGQYVDTNCDMNSVFSLMERAGFQFGTSIKIIQTLEAMAKFWSIAGVMRPDIVATYLIAITSLSHFMELLIPNGVSSFQYLQNHMVKLKESYVAHIKCILDKSPTAKLINWEMNLWCLNPGFGLRRILDSSMDPRSIIVTSGTLAPLRQLEVELEQSFPIQKQFNHLVGQEQFKVMLIGHSPRKYSLCSTFEASNDPKYSQALGNTLVPLFKMLPFGTLLFFSSYGLMQKVLQIWKSRYTDVWRDINQATRVFIESKERVQFEVDMDSFRKEINQGGRAVYFAVCRGKLSEGTNLEGNQCRSVIVVGLPFPSLQDAIVKETRAYHARRRNDQRGDRWYTNQMRRALCQAFGRVIRSKQDFGMLFLCEPRFINYSYGLSKWVEEFYPREELNDFGIIHEEVKKFFKQHDIDVNSIILPQTSNSSQNAVFEIDQTTRRLQDQTRLSIDQPPLTPPPMQTPSSGNGISSRLTMGVHERPIVTVQGPKTVLQRRAEILNSMNDSSAQNMPRKLKINRPLAATDPPELKRPKTTTEVFDDIFTETIEQHLDTTPTPEPKVPESVAKKIDEETVCYICKRVAVQPHIIHCRCARMGCFTCLKVLNGKPCGECDTILKSKRFKPKYFSSNPFQKKKK